MTEIDALGAYTPGDTNEIKEQELWSLDATFTDYILPRIKAFRKMKRHGYREFGIIPRLEKNKTLRKKLRRKAASKRAGTFTDEEDERFPFHSDDLKYRHIKK